MIQPPPPPKRHGRTYFSHRRAWSPRLWPIVIPTAITAAFLSWYLHPAWYLSLGIGIVLGVGIGQIRFAIWKHRHPVISPAEFLDLRRKAAPWN